MLISQKTWGILASIVTAIGLMPSVCLAVSFDCSKAQSFREKSVCSSTILSGLDDELNSAYRTATQTSGNKQALVDSQRKWIGDTNRCFDEGCLATAYRTRITELTASDAEDGDNDNVEHTSPPPAAIQQREGQAATGGLDGILNRANQVGQEADEKPSAVAPYFSTVDEFGSFYAGMEQGEDLDGERLAAGLERLIVANGGQFVGYSCSRQLAVNSPQMLRDFIRYKKSEVSRQPPTFFAQASEDAANAFSNSLGDLKSYMSQASEEPGCKRNVELVDSVLKDLGRAADSANEVARASLRASYAVQLERDKQLQAEQEAAAEKRAEEQRAEQARQDEEQRQAAARRGEEQARLAESQPKAAAEVNQEHRTQEQAAYQATDEARTAGDTAEARRKQTNSGGGNESKGWTLGGLFSSIKSFFLKLLLTGFFALGGTYLLIQRIRIELQGYVIDPENDEFSFPGGMISANSVSDYFKGNFITQAFQRFTIRLSDIQSLSAPTIRTTSVNQAGRVFQKDRHYVEIRGSFGAAKFRFFSEGKRDQLFAALRQANQMGMPVFRSN